MKTITILAGVALGTAFILELAVMIQLFRLASKILKFLNHA